MQVRRGRVHIRLHSGNILDASFIKILLQFSMNSLVLLIIRLARIPYRLSSNKRRPHRNEKASRGNQTLDSLIMSRLLYRCSITSFKSILTIFGVQEGRGQSVSTHSFEFSCDVRTCTHVLCKICSSRHRFKTRFSSSLHIFQHRNRLQLR